MMGLVSGIGQSTRLHDEGDHRCDWPMVWGFHGE